MASIEAVEQASSVAANVATVVALAVGGWWTYSRFFKNRSGKPRAAISHLTDDRSVTPEDVLIRVVIRVENTGLVVLPMKHLRCEISQVDPPSIEALDRLAARELINEEHLAELGCIRCYERDWSDGMVSIEPGESDFFPFDFIVPATLKTISIYAHILNSSEKKKEIGWDLSAFYDVKASPTEIAPATF
jgi:hypothetical protein